MRDMYRHLLGQNEDDWDPSMKVLIVLGSRIAEALESIAERLDELERNRRITGAKKGVRPAP